uniref:Si:dkey-86e18.1 n=1 Tax=Oryzias latipes TaxID=8090 RepID=A0A3P9LJR7_ORYLA
MARNEEKQQGRLNRLWLQKERHEGRLNDVNERRPKLSSLNSASSVKKWIPSINNEIEYFLQQSQLTHYPERKIEEFQLRIEALQQEYKRFITKLRSLDPSCKQKPWTPRAYTKRRADTQNSPRAGKVARLCEQSRDGNKSASSFLSAEGSHSFSESRSQTQAPTSPVSQTSEVASSIQDQPLTFDCIRLAVAAAAFRGPAAQPSSSQTHNLAQSGLPNLSSTSGQSFLLSPGNKEDTLRTMQNYALGHGGTRNTELDDEAAEGKLEQVSSSTNTTEKSSHVLGLDCYSSSDEDYST